MTLFSFCVCVGLNLHVCDWMSDCDTCDRFVHNDICMLPLFG